MIVGVFDPLRCSVSVLWDGRPRRINTFDRFKWKPFGCYLFFSKHVCSHKKTPRGETCPGPFLHLCVKDKRTKTSCELDDSSRVQHSGNLLEVILLVVMWETVTGQQREASFLILHRKYSMMTCTKMFRFVFFFTHNSELYKTRQFTFSKPTTLVLTFEPREKFYLKDCFPLRVKSISTQTARSKRVGSVRLDPRGKFLSCCWIFTSTFHRYIYICTQVGGFTL